MKNSIILFICFFLVSCAKNDSITPALDGTWIEVSNRTDTLVFQGFGEGETMLLNRGSEMQNGYMLPRAGSGPYEYRLEQGEISLRWLLSSSAAFVDYDFHKNNGTLEIENFYDSSLAGTMMTFERLSK